MSSLLDLSVLGISKIFVIRELDFYHYLAHFGNFTHLGKRKKQITLPVLFFREYITDKRKLIWPSFRSFFGEE